MPTPTEIQTCINNLTIADEPITFALLAAQTHAANNGISHSVPTLNDLPDLSTNSIGTGNIVFVDSLCIPLVNTDNEWKGLDGRVFRRDFIAIDRQLWSWGYGGNGILGDGTTVNKCSPVREISFSTDWCQVSAGGGSISAIKTSGQLWSWGSGVNGRLGDGTTVNKCSPVREISSSIDWCQVSAGSIHSAAVKTSGQLWAWGGGAYGRLGDGTTVNKCSPVREITSSTNWCQVSAGGYGSAAIKTSGQLWAWGRSNCGQLGDGTTVDRCSPVRERSSSTDWCQVSARFKHSAAIKTSGQLWAWGDSGSWQLGDGTFVSKCSPVREICSATDWCQVSAGTLFTTAAVKTSGQLWAWGRGYCGILGDGTTVSKCSPVREISSSTNWCQVSVGFCHIAAVKTSGQLWAWGNNGCGRLGDGTIVDRCSPVREICSATDWCQVSVGVAHNAALKLILR